ncbi:hypothetical protein DIZ81_06905 [Legionella taurinensis]|uniref:Uncharacterized protein n=1 Tax=Legionella taurinensis TaxID=70611 RepID=A0A3A5L338_9GAMM|nr:hypothetical protein [Legionella taurinensis]MDX1837199.1 hypothetical protein [Legionella taurinensis]PUT40326.1 hypothetical protein DB744_06905 [Legionella taurinensis]PUT41561.1 hypothetical protein DB746_09415 [Legionella taurinensis]PUT44426.1 hypothetical protein DB743_08630 [Legionella taurinensis]PUT48388.1 hypothetical protein DB745_05305 [Legionella taurinensis]
MAKGKHGGDKGFFMWKNWDSVLNADHFEAAFNDKDFTLKRLVKLQDLEGGKNDGVDQLLIHLIGFLRLTDPDNISINDNDRASAEALFVNLDNALTQVKAASADQKFEQSAVRYADEVIRLRMDLLKQQPTESLPLVWYNAAHKGHKNTF